MNSPYPTRASVGRYSYFFASRRGQYTSGDGQTGGGRKSGSSNCDNVLAVMKSGAERLHILAGAHFVLMQLPLEMMDIRMVDVLTLREI